MERIDLLQRIESQTQRIEKLEQELLIVHKQLNFFQRREMNDFVEKRRAALQFYREEYERKHPSRTAEGCGNDNWREGDGLDVVN